MMSAADIQSPVKFTPAPPSSQRGKRQTPAAAAGLFPSASAAVTRPSSVPRIHTLPSLAGSAGGRPLTSPVSARPATTPGRLPSASSVGAANTARKNHRRLTLLHDTESDRTLPQPLARGLAYVSEFTSFQDLIDKQIIDQRPQTAVRLAPVEVAQLYAARCADQQITPSWEREMRFIELLSQSCQGQHFTVSEHGFGPRSAAAIGDILATNDTFTIVDLSGNRIGNMGARHVAEAMRGNETVIHLGLKSNDIGTEGIEILAAALKENHALTSLDLGGMSGYNRNHVGCRGAELLGQIVASNPVLCKLDLSSTGLGVEGVGYISDGLRDNNTLTSLSLAGNSVGPDGCAVLSTALQSMELLHLDLKRNAIADDGALNIASALSHSESFLADKCLDVDLSSNGIGTDGCRRLASMVQVNRCLQSLTLADNDLADGFREFAARLQENVALTTLNVAQCNLGSEEASAFGAAMANCGMPHLKVLDMSRNRFGDEGGAALCESFRAAKKLQRVSLAACSLGPNAGRALAAALRRNTTLTDVSVKQNGIDSAAGDALCIALQANRTLLKFNISFNDAAYATLVSIDTVLKRNRDEFRKTQGPRLEAEIADLDYAQKEQYQIEEEISGERRSIKERTDDFMRRKDAHRVMGDVHRRHLMELNEKVAAGGAIRDDMVSRHRELQEQDGDDRMRMEAKASHLQHRVDIEREKRDRFTKEAEKLRKQSVAANEAHQAAIRPLQGDLEAAEAQRKASYAEAQAASGDLVALLLRLKNLERTLGVFPEMQPQHMEGSRHRRPSAVPAPPSHAAPGKA